jgi:endogenous inhibitor of DNA gyrase (YacG/DUF329 family)
MTKRLEEVLVTEDFVDICPNCGGMFSQNAKGRRKKFCSEKCRTAWNHRHVASTTCKGRARIAICPQCGKTFPAMREYGKQRKYCSVACSNRGRAEERRGQHAESKSDGNP